MQPVTTPDPAEKSITTLFARNSHLLVLTIVVFIVAGWSAIQNLPRLEDPRITTRGATILTFLPGASASRIEALVNEKIEDALEEIDEIKNVSSTARANVSNISIELQDSVDDPENEQIFSKIRSRLQSVQGDLPNGSSYPFLDDQRGATAYTLIAGIAWKGRNQPPLGLMQRLALELKDTLLNTSSTELVRIFGGVHEEIAVTPNQAELAALGLTPEALAQQIQAADSKVSAGQYRGKTQDFRIEVDGAFASTNRIASIPIQSSRQGTQLLLGDIASVTKQWQQPAQQIGYRDGNRVVYVAARSNETVRVDQWSKAALKKLAQFKATYETEQLGIDVVFEQNQYTEKRLSDLVSNLLAGAAVVIGIVLFTMGWKSSLVVGSILPLSAAGALFSFNFMGQTIHQMSIFGLIIAIGLLIDSAIVMTDEVRKQIQKGFSPLEAIDKSVRHLFVPLLASTITTILGFMPIFLLPGNAGDFVGPIAISVVLTLAFSLFLAMTVVPALAAKTLAKDAKKPGNAWWRFGLPSPSFIQDMKRVTYSALKRPRLSIGLLLIPSFVGFALIPTMPVEFFPPADRDMFEVQLYMPGTAAIQETLNVTKKADKTIRGLAGVKETHWLLGSSTPSVYYNQVPKQDNNSAFAQGVIKSKSPLQTDGLIQMVQQRLNTEIPEARVIAKKFAQGPPADAPVVFRLLGPNLDTLRQLGESVRRIMHQHPQVTNTRASLEGGQGKLWFEANETEAQKTGLSLLAIARQLEGNLEGYVGGSVLEETEELPVKVRLNNLQRANLPGIANLPIISPITSQWIPAETLGQFAIRPELTEITRYNGQRVNNVLAYLTTDAKPVSVSSAVLADVKKAVRIPAGYRIEVAGESEEQDEAIGGLATFTPVLLVLMVATLILSFRSVALAAIVGAVAILSIGLGMLSLKISGYALGFNPLIGTIGLAGVVINDTIVVLAAILSNPAAKAGDTAAIIEETFGCGRHVLSTTLTTIGGFIPLLLFSGGTFWPPLTVVIAGGLGFGLLLAMGVTPLAYKLFTILAKQQPQPNQTQPITH
ncbi:MAG: efflux RND transporter permease subunit [Cyanobacteria bacterium P01_H01_bin.74]